ncbi:hypothetical protein SAMN02745127_01875 [Oceanospirillum multiglobuliferum]|uniref:Uncharacterized protein n=1 Tax=Oceanospirillum multiglobuliferum TaxID=64969 RepID=A0A1T4QEB8_9GAMM|nr:hypothetical protein [Oceanospirillum multiglobuliferum]OPX56490.1 hypothetical protein BTE48_03430 [Oceanospirillum multiglobuliferum]SKA02082.1 hypothetical protein SAMN02745127_01875 [Oceanospirillum multiglobuliferum]
MDNSLSFESLLLIKIAVSVATVIGLSLIAEHVSPRIAGLLSGYPLGTAIALFFIGYEISPEFAAEGAVYTLAGFASTLMLTTGYWLGIKRLAVGTKHNTTTQTPDQQGRWLEVFTASALGVVCFVLSGLLIKLLPLTLLTAACLPALAILACIWGYRHISESQVGKKVKMSVSVLLFRAVVAALIVVLITGAAHWVPAATAGVLAAFPISMFPFLVLMHRTYGAEKALTVIKHYPTGLGSLMVYATSIAWCYPSLGLLWGTLLSFVFSTLYLLIAPPYIDRLRAYLVNR